MSSTLPLILIACGVSAVFAWASQKGIAHVGEQTTVSWRQLLSTERASTSRVAYVMADATALKTMGPQPWTRTQLARVVRALSHAEVGASVLYLDWDFSGMVHPFAQVGTEELAAAMRDTDIPLVLPASYVQGGLLWEGMVPLERDGYKAYGTVAPLRPEPVFWAHARVALADVLGTYLEIPAFVSHMEGPIYAVSLQAVAAFWGIEENGLEITGDRKGILFRGRDGRVQREVSLSTAQLMPILWKHRWRDAPVLSLSAVLDAVRVLESTESTVPQKEAARTLLSPLQRKIVLVGMTLDGRRDFIRGPMGEVHPAILAHGNAVSTLLDGKSPLYLVGWWETWLLGWGVSVLGALLLLQTRGVQGYILGPAVLVLYILAVWVLAQWSVFLPVVGVSGTVLGVTLPAVWWRNRAEQRERAHIRKTFGAYVPSALVDELLESPEPVMGGKEYEISMLFTDIVDFTHTSENMHAQQLVQLLNHYFTRVSCCVQSHDGILDKYMGDGVAAFFGAPIAQPKHVEQAVLCACDILEEKQIPFRTRIGLHTGKAIVGNIGSVERTSYTMVGSAVNLASRCERISRYYGVGAVLTGQVVAGLSESLRERVVLRKLDHVKLAGLNSPCLLYELLGYKRSEQGKWMQLIERYEAGLDAYMEGNWDSAISLMRQAKVLERSALNPASVLLERMDTLRLYPQESWKGFYSYEMK